MKVLFCSPYLDSQNVVKGGINTWGNYVLNYWRKNGLNDVEIIPISFDRHREVGEVSTGFISRVGSGLKELGSSSKLAIKEMKYNCPDVVHLCTSASLSLLKDIILIKAAKKYNIKTILHLHFGRIPELQKINNWEWKLLLKTIRMVDVPVVMDEKSLNVLKANGLTNTVFLPNPLSEDVLNYCNRNQDKVKIPNQLLFVGHVLKSKGVIELVEGCVNIPNTKLRIVGKYSDDMKQELITLAKKRDNGNWLTFVGEMSHEDVIQEFLSAEIFVFPSYTEGFPNVILEAMACGCTIVASNVGAIPEMLDVDHNACGLCISPRSTKSVTNAVYKIQNDPILKKGLAEAAKQRVKEKYAMSKVWNQLIKLWN